MGIEMIKDNAKIRQQAMLRLALGVAQIMVATAALVTWLAGGPVVVVGVLVMLTIGLIGTSRLWYRDR